MHASLAGRSQSGCSWRLRTHLAPRALLRQLRGNDTRLHNDLPHCHFRRTGDTPEARKRPGIRGLLTRYLPVVPHVELALVLMRSAKPEPFVEPQSGIGLYHSESERLAGPRRFFDQAFDHFGANALPSQSDAYEKLAEEQRVVFQEALQPTNIRLAKSDDPNLRHVPALAKAGGMSVHVQVQLLDDVLHSLKIETRAIIEVFGVGWSESR